MSADSSKPDAGEWVRKYESSAKPLEVFLADFQRETLLWAANRLRNFYLVNGEGVAHELERLAESCGRK